MSISLDTTANSQVVVALVRLLSSDKYHISTTSESDLSLKHENGEELKGADVIEFLVKENPSLVGQSEQEKADVNTWLAKKVNIGELNKHLNLRVYIADGLHPTVADFTVFVALRDQIMKQKAPQRNQFANVTRWFNHLQPFFAPHLPAVPIKLDYTAPPKKEKKQEKKPNKQNQRRAPAEKITGFQRLRLQVGKIVSIGIHPTVESLYVEQIDLGEENPRTVVSKLAEKIPIEEMKDRLVVVGSNLQPATLQGVESAGLVFCASIGDNVEVLTPPQGSQIGEDIQVKGLTIQPDQTPISRKVFSKAIKGLSTNDDCIACFKGTPLSTSKGVVSVASLKGAEIK